MISWGYHGDIMGISWGYHGDIMGMSIMGISWGYLRDKGLGAIEHVYANVETID